MVTLLLILIAIVLLIILGVAVVGIALKLVWWAFVGLVIGGLARLVLRDTPPIGWLATIAAGIAGSLLAGIAGSLLGGVAGNILGGNWLLELVLAVAIAALLIVWLGGRRGAYA